MSNVVAIPHLSFATDLLFNLEDVRANCTSGLSTQQSIVTMLKTRIALERHYANELNKMAQQSRLEELEHGTMKEALGKLKAQYLNTSVQHRSLANNLEEDVLKPIEALWTYNSHKAQNLNKLVSNIKKQAKVHEDAYKKDYQAFEKLFREATVQFAVAMDAGFSSTLIEEQYIQYLAEMTESDHPGNVACSRRSSLSPMGRARLRSGAASTPVNHSQKLVNWLLSSEQQRKDSVCTNAAKLLESAEVARRKCIESWDVVEQSRIDMYRALQSVLTEFQQIAEHRISNLATNLRKHVVFESSALANEQYDWQMIASKIENVDFEGDIREFILRHQSEELQTMTLSDLCASPATNSLLLSPSDKPSQPLKRLPLQISDLAMRRIPHETSGKQEPLPELLVVRMTPSLSIAQSERSRTCDSQRIDAPADAPPVPHRQLTVKTDIPVNKRKHDSRDAAQLRVSLAQDVARAIARAYEMRAAQSASCVPYSPRGVPESDEEDSSKDVTAMVFGSIDDSDSQRSISQGNDNDER
ncbi:hypothetical protein PINS_up009158 [Pythium insidiosum]|nr:hypothetical protein PINS_up009158 [Pythium insidiosum]